MQLLSLWQSIHEHHTGMERTDPQMMSLSPTVTISGLLASFQRQMWPSGVGGFAAFHSHTACSTWEDQRSCRWFKTGMVKCTGHVRAWAAFVEAHVGLQHLACQYDSMHMAAATA